MDYEKKYKEALKRAKEWHNDSHITIGLKGNLEDIFPELKESEDVDKKIREEIIATIHLYYGEPLEDEAKEMIAWLENQGEQKHVNKVEPKFKVGDWIVWQNKCYKVNYNGCGYELIDQNGLSTSLEYGTVDKSAHLWTIQDANDGDVLACPLPKGYEAGEQIFIFKEINSRTYVDNCIEFYCRVHEGVFYENENNCGYMGTTSSPIYPATKEQRETLIKAMNDAGYTFDFENKELKKIAPSNKELEGKV